ncbi:hypothetical protein HK103_007105 [Boothiomyces macroporosus]|uniref:Uncharacterized protein n=1 Tax=Boothiomyces macroporosus TaxID=261099 RepID=A0AAD5UCI5_9FUNG|nr:hypothetical protein HK103_007105 [Boothiomyces macroporosus]
MSALLVENQFFSPYCQTAPDTIYVFNVSDPFAYDPTLPGVWPSFFRFHFEDFTVGDVDNCYVPIAGTACTSSLDTARSAPYQSGSTNWFDTLSDIESVVPKSANGKSYCMLSATNMQDQSALLGYKAVFLQAVDGVCYDGKFNCNHAGLFTYFESSGCKGAFESIQMPSSSSNITLPSLGNLTVQLKTFKSASMFYDWQQNSPVTRLVPQWNIPFDYIAAAFFIFAVLIGLYPPAITVYGAIVKKKKLLFLNYVVVFSQICIVLWTLLSMIFWLTVFPNNEIMARFAEARTLFFNLGSVISTFVTSNLYVIIFFKSKKYMIYPIQLFVACMHIFLDGGNYIDYYINGGDNNYMYSAMPVSYQKFLNYWFRFANFWIIFMFIWNCIPPILISLMFINAIAGDKTIMEKLKLLILCDPYLPFLFIGQFIAISGFEIIRYIRRSTTILGGDMVFQDTTCFNVFFVALHISLTTRINETMKIVSKPNSRISKERFSKTQESDTGPSKIDKLPRRTMSEAEYQ